MTTDMNTPAPVQRISIEKKSPRAVLLELGCRLNQCEGEAIASALRASGFEIALAPEDVDLAIVNSCGVTATASSKSFAAVRRLRRDNPKAFIIFSGCAASLPSENLPCDIVVPSVSKDSIPKLAAEHFGLAQTSSPELRPGGAKTRAYLKIQDGCNNFCAFCVVPFARGRERSLEPKALRESFTRLLDAGFKEVVLTGVNLCAYSRDGLDLPALVESFLALPGDFRLRLGSTEPHPSLARLAEIMESDRKLCRFLHLPLQHGADSILKSMGRKYLTANFAELVAMARSLVPGIHIGTDIIAGLPGETEELFEESKNFLETQSFSNMHVFSYSPRDGTRAAEMPGQVSEAELRRRHDILKELAASKAKEFALSQIGKPLAMLTERPKKQGFASGWSDNYLKLELPASPPSRNEFIEVIAKTIDDNGVLMCGKA